MNISYRKESAGIPLLGIFTLRIPFVHYRWELSETIQAFFLFSVAMAAIPFIQEAFPWVSFEVAWTAVFWFTLTFWLTATLGDPTVPGWITAAIPVVLSYIKLYPETAYADRVWALVSIQLLLAVLCIISGPTGLADWLNRRVPVGIRAGVVLGAGFSAIINEIKVDGRFMKSPWSIGIASFLAFYLLWSVSFKKIQSRNKLFLNMSKYGYVPALILGSIFGLFIKEIPVPTVEWGIFVPRISEQFATMSIFGYGFPPIAHLIKAIPTAVVVYIILFGDWIIIDALRTEANEVRTDQYIDFSIARSSTITAFRNLWSAIFAPYATTAGPLWSGIAVGVYERYKTGKEAMPTIWGGLLSFQLWWPILVFIVPLITLMKPFLPLAASTTMLIQGFACFFIAMLMSRDKLDLGTAGIVGIALWRFGAVYALGVGFILWLILIQTKDEPKAAA